LSRPTPSSRHFTQPNSFVRVNGKIRAREVRVIGPDGAQLGVLPLNDAIAMARNQGVDLVEVAPNAAPPVCRLVDYGKYRYEQAKKEKDSRRHQHANKVKEIQLSPTIDAHDFGVKLGHAVDFLCEEMKIKLTLKFRGREMAHQEYGFQVVEKFIKELAPYGHPDAQPRLIGRGINVMLSPLPRNKRAKNPNQAPAASQVGLPSQMPTQPQAQFKPKVLAPPAASGLASSSSGGFVNNPFAKIEAKLGQ
jgi:translation initiation factor IF-3